MLTLSFESHYGYLSAVGAGMGKDLTGGKAAKRGEK